MTGIFRLDFQFLLLSQTQLKCFVVQRRLIPAKIDSRIQPLAHSAYQH
jgi:hypothetical protein